MSKHTPGPWLLLQCDRDISGGAEHEIVAGHHMACVASVSIESHASIHGEDGMTSIEGTESLANARLIAAAPELLQALQHICDELLDGDEFDAKAIARHAGRAAIAKATGDE